MEIKEEKLEEKPKDSRNNKRSIIIRVLVSIVAFIALVKFGKIDIHDALNYLLTIDPFYFSLALVTYMITLVISGFRFRLAAAPHGFLKNVSQCIQLNFVGTFFNNFLPTTVGGDALRGYYLKRGTNVSALKAAGCILCERFTGMMVLFWISAFVFFLRDINVISKATWKLPYAMALLSYAGTVGSLIVPPFVPVIVRKIFSSESWIYKKFIEPIYIYWEDISLIIKIYAYSFLLQCSVILVHYFVAIALGLNIPLEYYLIFYPLTTIAGFLVPSLNGLGVREGGYIYFLTVVGISKVHGMAFSLGILVILLISSVIGGLIYLFGNFREHKHVSC